MTLTKASCDNRVLLPHLIKLRRSSSGSLYTIGIGKSIKDINRSLSSGLGSARTPMNSIPPPCVQWLSKSPIYSNISVRHGERRDVRVTNTVIISSLTKPASVSDTAATNISTGTGVVRITGETIPRRRKRLSRDNA